MSAWEQRYRDGDIVGRGTHYERQIGCNEYSRNIRFAGESTRLRGGVEMREARHYAGGPGFNAKEWPHVSLGVSLPEGRFDLRDKLGELLRAAVDAFIAEHNLEPEEVPED